MPKLINLTGPESSREAKDKTILIKILTKSLKVSVTSKNSETAGLQTSKALYRCINVLNNLTLINLLTFCCTCMETIEKKS